MTNQNEDLKAELLAKVKAAGMEADKRFSVARLESMLAEHASKEAIPPGAFVSGPEPTPFPEPEPEHPEHKEVSSQDEVEAMRKQLEDMRRQLEAKAASEAAKLEFQPAKPPPSVETNSPTNPMVLCRVTKQGDNQIFTGQLDSDARFKWGDVIYLPESVAIELELRTYLEIGESQ